MAACRGGLGWHGMAETGRRYSGEFSPALLENFIAPNFASSDPTDVLEVGSSLITVIKSFVISDSQNVDESRGVIPSDLFIDGRYSITRSIKWDR
ncbi:hypothetical protein TWF569_008765 [Orbilia oligospora]|uniref:Uncharacterized protein n=1 Tax=Orbilia oligospora TaxID=2813651 RepID=A0A7C8P6P0_ORBOL|nr:hypothetical protein TWF706_007502 [Orbilia oligospora]KAF3135778.1 hypothetical protein TWF703_005873 [Orbilia oligospora]KAF3138265.1 hypothetical protein TWF569_008765 [Orbilia oligospora]